MLNSSTPKRSCTDFPCLVIFGITILGWIIIAIFAVVNGQPESILSPKDSMGGRCGVDYHVATKPYLLYFDLALCDDVAVPFTGCFTPHVCVEECPDEIFIYNDPYDIKNKKLHCYYDTEDWDENKCAKWYLPSYPYRGRCIPRYFDTYMLERISEIRDTNVTIQKMEKAIKQIKFLTQVSHATQDIINDVMHSWWKIILVSVLAGLICIIYVLLLSIIPALVVWFSIISLLGILSVSIYFSVARYKVYANREMQLTLKDEINEDEEFSVRTKANLWLSMIIILSIVLGLTLISIIVRHKLVTTGIVLARESGKIIKQVPRVWLFPVFTWVIQLIVIMFTMAVGIHLAAEGDPVFHIDNLSEDCKQFLDSQLHISFKEDSKCIPSQFKEAMELGNSTACHKTHCKFHSISNSRYYILRQTYNIVIFLWLLSLISAAEQMILAFVYSKWYWCKDKDNFEDYSLTHSTLLTFRYHLGTLAFGGAVIALYRYFLLKIAVHIVNTRIRHDTNQFTHACIWCLSFFLLFSEKFLIFVTFDAYIYSAFYGQNFCNSAKKAYKLTSRNSYTFKSLNVSFVIFILKLFITVCSGVVAYLLFVTRFSLVDHAGFHYTLVPVILIMACSYLASTEFLGIYTMAIETVFICVLEEYEHTGTLEGFQISENILKAMKVEGN